MQLINFQPEFRINIKENIVMAIIRKMQSKTRGGDFMWYFIAGACAGVGCICVCEFMFG